MNSGRPKLDTAGSIQPFRSWLNAVILAVLCISLAACVGSVAPTPTVMLASSEVEPTPTALTGVEWIRRFNLGGYATWASAQETDQDGNNYLVGGTQEPEPNDHGQVGHPFVRKFDARGSVVWTLKIPANSYEATALAIDASGIYVAGDNFIAKLGFESGVLWLRQDWAGEDARFKAIALGEERVYASGHFQRDTFYNRIIALDKGTGKEVLLDIRVLGEPEPYLARYGSGNTRVSRLAVFGDHFYICGQTD